MIIWEEQPANEMIGLSEIMPFILDENGEWIVSEENRTTSGSTIKVNGTITASDSSVFNVRCKSSQGYEKEYDDVSTGNNLDFLIQTNSGSTQITLKVWSANGSADEGLEGTMTLNV